MTHPARTLLVALAAVLATTATARADHSDGERATDDSPYVLRPGEVRIGLDKSQLGLAGHPVLRRIELGTHHLPWFFALAGARTYNLHANALLYRGDRLALGAGIGHTFIGFEDGDGSVAVRATPVEANLAVELNHRLTLTTNLVHTRVDVRGAMQDTADIDELWGAVGSSTTHVRSGLEVRLSNRTALRFGARVIVGQTVRGATGASEDMDGTTVSGGASVESDVVDMRGDVTASAAVHWSWKRTNLELGAQYGSISVPGVNLAIPGRHLMPKVDLYWRF